MKTTLTQAWEAKGFAGAILRSRARWELVSKFYKEDPRRNILARNFAFEFPFAIMMVVLAYLLFGLATRGLLPIVDLSRTLDFALVASYIVAIAAMVFATILFAYFALKNLYALGNIDRYIFQHRDEEVEL